MGDLAVRVATLTAPSRAIVRYVGALIQARDMERLPLSAADRELRIRNTRIVAQRRFRLLSAADRARVEAVDGGIE